MDDYVLPLARDIYTRMMSMPERPAGAARMAEEAFKFAKVFYQVLEKERQKDE